MSQRCTAFAGTCVLVTAMFRVCGLVRTPNYPPLRNNISWQRSVLLGQRCAVYAATCVFLATMSGAPLRAGPGQDQARPTRRTSPDIMWPFHHSGFRIEDLFQISHGVVTSEYPIRLTWVWWLYVIVWMRFSRKAKGNITTATNDRPLKISGPRPSYLSYSEGAFIIGLATSSRAYHITSAFRPVSRSRPCLERLFSGLGLAQRLQ